VRGAAASATGYERLHLYRGELWTRTPEPPPGLTVVPFTAADLAALDEGSRRALLSRLELDETGCLETWARGDQAVLARDGERPIGVAWCARAAAWVPELGREVRPGPSECYIHDVFVAEDARGRSVAPSMLEALARRLRQADVYRAWALIRPANVASQRAFEKAAYAAVCDVIHTRLAGDRLILRPSDAEAQRLFGVGAASSGGNGNKEV
jgi:GNAT superfamily N-acetyltransferase